MPEPIGYARATSEVNLRTNRVARLLNLDGSQSIRFRILALVLSIVVPLACLFLWSSIRFAATKIELIDLQRFDLSSRVSMRIDREINGAMGMLTGLANSEDLFSSNPSDYSRHAAGLLATNAVTAVWAINSNGVVEERTVVPRSATPRSIRKSDLDKVFEGKHVVSPIIDGGSAAAALVAVPVRDASGIAYALVARVPVANLSTVFKDVGVQPTWVSAIIDSEGRFVARSLAPERWLGELARPELVAVTRSPEAIGNFDNVTHEGVPMRNSFHRSDMTGWTTVVAVPQSELRAPLRRAILLFLLGGASILAATLLAASWFAAQISDPVRLLSQYAHAVATGSPPPPQDENITELNEVRKALEDAISGTARLSAIVASSGDAIVSMDLDGSIRTWNRGAEQLFGYMADEVIGSPKTILVPDGNMAEFEAQTARVLSGESFRTETKRKKRDGTVIDVSIDAAPIRRPDGRIVAISSILHDITDAKRADEHRLFLMRELAHRSKNQLAIIQSIANQTGRRSADLQSFLASFRQRLQGLAASHDLLLSQGWQAVELSHLIAKQLSVFADIENPNVKAVGPAVRINPVSAETIGLALHELATNSAKYGALSVPEGLVDIRWSVEPEGTQTALTLSWTETNGPAVTPPSSRGFGSQVIETLVARSLGGEARIDYLPTGIIWNLRCRLK